MNWLRMTLCTTAGALALSSLAQSYRFSLDPNRSYTDGYVQVRLWTSGSFRGDFDSEKNPQGTRTKAGTAGDFAISENGAVLAKPFFEFHNSSVVRSSGHFDLSVDLENRKAVLDSYTVERLASGPISLRTECVLNNEPFRTTGPDAVMNPDMPAFGSGQVELHRLTFVQKPGPRMGTVVDMGNGWYRVSVTFMADVEVDIVDLEQRGPMKFTMAASLVGNFRKCDDGTATFGYPKGLGGDNLARELDVPLDDFPVSVPVSVDSNSKSVKARIRLLANVGKVTLAINGVRELLAFGKPTGQGVLREVPHR